MERLITHLPWLLDGATMVGGAAMLVAVKDAIAAVVVVCLGAMGAAVVVVNGTIVVLLVWLLE